MCARACAACVVAYLVSFFLVSRIEMCVSGVRNEPQKEGGRREGGREGAAGSFFSRSNHIGRSDDGGRRKARARAHSLSLFLVLFL